MAYYCTSDQVVAEIKNQAISAEDLAAISERIPRACALIDGHCGHSFYDEAIQNEICRGGQVQLDKWGNLRVSVKKAMVQSVALASVTADFRSWTVLPLDALDIQRHVLEFVQPGLSFRNTVPLWVRISYQGGYASDKLPKEIENAAVRWTSFLYHKRDAPFDITSFPSVGQISVPSSIPPDIVQLLSRHKRVVP